jgi:putative ABC transport system permease protein
VLSVSYALTILWNERGRFVPAVLAVGFSALLIALQFGLLIGTLSFTTTPIDNSRADVWVTSADVPSVDAAFPLRETAISSIASTPGVARVEPFIYGFAAWDKPDGGSVVCCVIGSRLDSPSMGAMNELTDELRGRLARPGAVVVDRSDLERLGVTDGVTGGVGRKVEVGGQTAQVVGVTEGVRSIGAPYVLCSRRTARMLVPMLKNYPGHVSYYLVRCEPGYGPASVARAIDRGSADLSAHTAADFSRKTRMNWLTQSKAGIALGVTSGLALLVGVVVTGQTLYSAILSSLREYAMLRALGIPRWRIGALVMTQSFWIGVIGAIAAAPLVLGAVRLGERLGARVELPPWLIASAAAVTVVSALLSGLWALRSLRHVEPITLLR